MKYYTIEKYNEIIERFLFKKAAIDYLIAIMNKSKQKFTDGYLLNMIEKEGSEVIGNNFYKVTNTCTYKRYKNIDFRISDYNTYTAVSMVGNPETKVVYEDTTNFKEIKIEGLPYIPPKTTKIEKEVIKDWTSSDKKIETIETNCIYIREIVFYEEFQPN